MYEQKKMFEREEGAQSDKYLTFTVDDTDYGINIRFVTEIIGMQTLSTLPEVPEFIKGILNLRGKIIPVVDMRLRFGTQEAPYSDRTCIVVAETEQFTAGLIVDRVSDVMVIRKDTIVPLPDFKLKDRHGYISGIGKTGTAAVKLLVDCDKLLDGRELNRVKNVH